MDSCIVCLEHTEDKSSKIYKTSSDWCTNHIQKIIEKHLWWWIEPTEKEQWICKECWHQLKTFHNFYNHVRKQHQFNSKALYFALKDVDEQQTNSSPSKENYLEVDSVVEPTVLENVEIKEEDQFNLSFEHDDYPGKRSQLEEIVEVNVELLEYNADDADNQQTDEEYNDEDGDDAAENLGKKFYFKKAKQKSSMKKNEEILRASNQQLECCLCSVKLKNFLKLKTHFRNVHNTNGYTYCCGKKFVEANKYADHLNVHANPDYFKCQQCGRVLANRICFNYHLEQHKPKEDRRIRTRKREIIETETVDGLEEPTLSAKRKNELILNNSNSELECSICSKKLQNFLELKSHFRDEHNCTGYTYCCGKKFIEPNKFADHLNVHANPDFFKCPECNRVMGNRISLRYHMETHKPLEQRCMPQSKKSTKPKDSKTDLTSARERNAEILNSLNNDFVCGVCSQTLNSFYELKDHFREEHSIRGYTLCCGRKFFEAGRFIDHLHVHANPDYFKCNVCSKILANRTCYRYHMEIHDPAKVRERKFRCEECGKGFALKKRYEFHKLNHTPEEMRTFKCTQCAKRYPTQRHLTSHMDVAHFNKYYRVCDICGKSLRDLATFKRHKEEHEKGKATKFPCDLCGIELTNRILLNRHKKFKHQEENLKPQKCPHCEKIISCKWSLIQHINYAHKTARKHHCQFCGKSFKVAKALREHLSIHTGEPVFTCAFCQETFRTSVKYYRHRKEAHPKEYEEERLKRQPKFNIQIVPAPEERVDETLNVEFFSDN